MNNRLKKLITGCCLSITMIPEILLADDLRFIPRTWIGIADYSFDQAPRKGALPDGSDFPEVKFDAALLVVGVGLTTTYDHFFLDLSYQDSSEEEDSFSDAGYYEKFTGDRRDYATTLGMKILDYKGTIYIGYKNGKTSGRGQSGTQLTFKEDGFFIGSSYGWIISDIGLLSVNIAYADLDGNLKEEPGPGYPSGLGMDADSEASGSSYGILWSSHLFNDIGYTLSIDANSYEFDHIKENSTTSLPDKIEEELITAKFSISYRF